MSDVVWKIVPSSWSFFRMLPEIRQVAVMGDGDIPAFVQDGERLDVRLVVGGACGGVAVVADGIVPEEDGGQKRGAL